ncbi:MAG: gabD 1 [Planctomycetota bacterium]|nr:gabD 1 [Planctomycetota bacterium]
MFDDVLHRLGLSDVNSGACGRGWISWPSGEMRPSFNPATGEPIARVLMGGPEDYDRVTNDAVEVFASWRTVPAPRRGEVVRKIGLALRENKDDLGMLVTLETGKILDEGRGEVQEMIDMADFAVGLSRQLHGLTIASERPDHRMFEQWHPLGPVGVITAFNFPVAVWAWNAMLAAVCGDTTIWKPSPETPLTAIAVQNLVNRVCESEGYPGVFTLCAGEAADVGEAMIHDPRLPLISATGSCRMGWRVGEVVGRRLGRALLELGGNNAAIVTPDANLDLALRGIVFAAVGTAGQRCTTLRRLIVHESIAEELIGRLTQVYASLSIGDPWDESTLVGPLISEAAVVGMMEALDQARAQGGTVVCGGTRLPRPGHFVSPAIVRAHPGMAIAREETFAPILYVITYRTLDDAIAIQNGVTQGLSSAIFTDRLSEAERFLSVTGSDCGLANVNLGTSGAEIGGAFGGEKATGGGRESGSDAWKQYMRRQTCVVNGGSDLPLAQGVRFDIPS